MSFTLHRPCSTEEALRLLRDTGGIPLAGGTVLMVDYNRGKTLSPHLISLEDIPGWGCIRETPDALLLGPLVTFDQIEESDLCREYAGALWQAARCVGGPQVRNRATIGGNLAAASPSADSAAPLLALGAQLILMSAYDTRTMPLTGFFVGPGKTVLLPGELIAGILIPKSDLRSRFCKVGKRGALAVSCASLALSGRITGSGSLCNIMVAAGAVAPTPVLCPGTAAVLNAGAVTEERILAAQKVLLTEIAPIDDRWATAEYRRTVCCNLLPVLLEQVKRGDAL